MSQDGNAIEKDSLHFITGATSLFGSEYLSAVLAADNRCRCALLIRAKSQSTAEIKANNLMHYLYGGGALYERMRQRIDVYRGDISEKHFGLDLNVWLELSQSINYIFHGASNSNISDSDDNLYSVNVMGTVSVLNFALKCNQLRRMLHISTAYVSGNKSGQISPDELDMKRQVNDYYQLSKRVAEKLVREQFEKLPIVILRPSTIVGHSISGRTISYKAFYYLTRMLITGHRITYPCSKNGKVEAIPADWAANIAIRLLNKKGIEGRSFHLTMGDRAYTAQQVKRIILSSLDKQGAQYKPLRLIPRLPYEIFVAPLISILHPEGRSLNRNFRLLSNYTCINRNFENADTFRAAGEDKNSLPGLEGYYDRLCRYAMTNKWRQPKAPR